MGTYFPDVSISIARGRQRIRSKGHFALCSLVGHVVYECVDWCMNWLVCVVIAGVGCCVHRVPSFFFFLSLKILVLY